MKKLLLAAVAISALSIGSTAAMADNHGGEGHKKGKMMEKVDTDGDGLISKAEFMAKHEAKFVEMDTDGNGLISKEEMKEAHMNRKEMKDKKEEMKEKSE